MAKELKTNAMRLLDRAKIPYQFHTYEADEFVDGITTAKKLNQPPEQCFKTLVTHGKSGGYYVFVLPVDKELDLKKAAKAVGEKSVEMIPVKEINALTGYIRGGCSPLGMKKAYPTVVHESAKQYDTIMISGGRIGMQLELSPLHLVELIRGKFEDIIQQ